MSRPRLSWQEVWGFTERFLWERFAGKVALSDLQRKLWTLACQPALYVGFAVPREHTKTTSLPKARGLACALFQQHPFQLKVGATHDLALEIIRWCATEVTENELILQAFNPRVVQNQVDDLIVEATNPVTEERHKFRWVATGMSQAKRGLVWGTYRPSLIDVDDVETDEDVLNPETRNATEDRLLSVIVPMGDEATEIRVYGTIMHQDAMLARVLKNESWQTTRLEACDENLENILWPEKFPKERLFAMKTMFVRAGKLDKFNMEYRNLAIDSETSFFRPEDFRPMTEEDHKRPKRFYVGGDLAFSKKEKRDYTVFVVGGIDDEGILHIVDERRGRWDGKEVIDEMYRIEEAWHPEEWFVESGSIKETLGAALDLRMAEEGYLNLRPGLIPTKDKATRANPIQARMRSKGLRFDTDGAWFPDYKQEMLEFAQEGTRGAHDDRVDATAWLGQGIKTMSPPETAEEQEQRELREAWGQARMPAANDDSCTGYERLRAMIR